MTTDFHTTKLALVARLRQDATAESEVCEKKIVHHETRLAQLEHLGEDIEEALRLVVREAERIETLLDDALAEKMKATETLRGIEKDQAVN